MTVPATPEPRCRCECGGLNCAALSDAEDLRVKVTVALAQTEAENARLRASLNAHRLALVILEQALTEAEQETP